MAIKEKAVKTVKVEWQCESCGKGTVVTDSGLTLTSHPPQYMGQCTSCGANVLLGSMYPQIQYRELEIKIETPVDCDPVKTKDEDPKPEVVE